MDARLGSCLLGIVLGNKFNLAYWFVAVVMGLSREDTEAGKSLPVGGTRCHQASKTVFLKLSGTLKGGRTGQEC